MSFLSPLFLAGLPLLAIPVVIHLLSRRQQKRISWGAMRFLMQAATRKRRLWRLTDLLLLLLRTAALLFFIFALARPLLPTTWLGGSVPRDIILVLDQSMSMSRQDGAAAVFDLQLEQANALLDELTGADTIRVLLAGESPEWLSPEPLLATGSALRKLREQLAELEPTLGAAELVSCVREAADLEAPKDKSARVIYVISDGQRLGWRLDESPLWAAVQARLRQSPIPAAVNLQLLGTGEPPGNLCVSTLETPRAFGAKLQPLTFTASIRNHGTEPSAAALLSWRAAGQSIGVSTVPELGPGAGTTVSLAHAFDSAGMFDVTCQLEVTDALAADNEAHLLVEVHEQLPVLVVEDPGEQLDTPFILAALGSSRQGASRPGWRSVFEPTTADPAALETMDLSGYRCVLLLNVPSLPAESISRLESYVEGGGGVWLVLGNRTDGALFNERFHRAGLGLSPLKLAAPAGDPSNHESFIPLRATSDAHPATALLADFQRLDLDRVRVYRRHQFDPFSGKDVSLLLQGPGGEPIVVERRLGRGRVLVQAIPLGASWSSLPLCQVYVALLHEWLWYLSEPSLPRRNLAVGETLFAPAASEQETAELRLPDARAVDLSASVIGGRAQFRYVGTRLPGEYALTLRDVSGEPSKFYVRRNPEESNLQPMTDAERQKLAAIDGFRLNNGLKALDAAGQIQIPKQPLEGWLLTALAFVLLGELTLAGWTTHQRRLRAKPINL